MASASTRTQSRDKTAERSLFAHAETLTSSHFIGDQHAVIGFSDRRGFPDIPGRNF
jgi:hypothetical protein